MNFLQSRARGHWLMAFGVATFLVILLGAHSYIVYSYTLETSKWADQFLDTIVAWYLWAAFFPFVLLLAMRYRFGHGQKVKSALIHILAGAAAAAIHAFIQILITDFLLDPERDWKTVQTLMANQFLSGLFWRFFVYQAILLVSIATDSYQRARDIEVQASQMEAGIFQAQIESLKIQLDPDFLFKSLNRLSHLMHRNFDEAESMVARLGEYLRMRLDHSASSGTSLREEMELLNCYLEIENIQTGNRAEIDFDVEKRALDCDVPGTILQASVEDALGRRLYGESLRLKITARIEDSSLLLILRDPLIEKSISESSKLHQLVKKLNAINRESIEVNQDVNVDAIVTHIHIPIVADKWNLNEAQGIGTKGHDSATFESDSGFLMNPVRKWIVIIAIFTAFAVYFTIQRLIIHETRGTTMNWPLHLLDYTGWYVWALITPFVLKLSKKYPLQKQRWFKHATIHVIGLAGSWFFATLTFEVVKWAANLADYNFFEMLPMRLARAPFSLDILCYSIIVALENALRYHRHLEFGKVKTVRLTAQLARARLDALKMQIHPHFLFNALNSLSELMREDKTAAEEMIRNLEMFLRLTVNHNHLQEIPFERELEFLRCYLAIENVRYQDRLNVKIEIEPQALAVPVPNLLLQPIVENAIRHGISPRTSAGQIEIQAKRHNGMLTVSVRDNGPGLTQSMKKKGSPARSGLGLTNTRERLIQLYGDSQRFELINAPEGGLIVIVNIPVKSTIQ